MDEMSFPRIETKNQAVKLTTAGEKSVRSQHPWIFESSISKISDKITPGDRAIIFGKKKNQLIGIGLIDPFSPIRIKMISFGKKAEINQEWFFSKFKECYVLREKLLITNTNSFRLCYGENDGLPGLIIDIYDHVAVMKIYSLIWLPYLEIITAAIVQINNILQYNQSLKAIVFRMSRNVEKQKEFLSGLQNGTVLYGNLQDEVVVFREHGVLFSANVIYGHKTGYFLDHRENRRKVGAFAQNKKVLDVFSYAGGFSVHALVGGASSVVSVDISKQALELAKYNASLNGKYNNHTCMAGDAFVIMKQLIQSQEKFNLVVVDPPSFAKKASEVSTALKTYRRLTKLAIQLADKKAIMVLASCSSRVTSDEFQDLINSELHKSGRKFHLIESTTHDIDHPIGFPEGAYLKTLYIKMD